MIFLGIFNYGAALLMLLFGIFTILAARNLMRKVIGMFIMQTGVILFFISLAFKWDAKLPVIPAKGDPSLLDPQLFTNPLPHALMLTAIVVGVSLLGVALVLIVSIYNAHGTMEEDEILKNLESDAS